MRRSLIAALVTAFVIAPRILPGQERGAAALRELTDGLATTVRVLMIGAHPDDEDTQLIAWLSRGRHVETAYLSLTRGDGGQNLIGNELGEALGVLRTEELLAARRIDGARQFFTRAYDFGFSKSAEETFRHWPKDSLLKDVVTVVREFRPHVIVSVFSGTARDGHGQHQAAGILAREAFDLAGDGTRFPDSRPAWRPAKFYRSAWFMPATATLRFNVGEYSPLLGRSYAEIAGESRSQHKSQAFGSLQRKGVVWDHLRREASNVDAATDPKAERSIFEGIDTTWQRLRAVAPATVDSITALIADAGRAVRATDDRAAARALARLAGVAARGMQLSRCGGARPAAAPPACGQPAFDYRASLARLEERATRAALIAAGVAIEATVGREVVAIDDTATVDVAIYARNRDSIGVAHGRFDGRSFVPVKSPRDGAEVPERVIAPDSSVRLAHRDFELRRLTEPEWLVEPRTGDVFAMSPAQGVGLEAAEPDALRLPVWIAGVRLEARAPIVHRYADPVRGEVQQPVAVVPTVSVTVAEPVQFVRARSPVERTFTITLRSGHSAPQRVRVSATLPAGLTAAPLAEVTLPAHGQRTVELRVRGQVAPGQHEIAVAAEARGERYTRGYTEIGYAHIRPRRLYRAAMVTLRSVDATVPSVAVGYISGVGDNVLPMLRQLGVDAVALDPAALPTTDLSRFGTIVIGPRAYESHDALVANNARLLEWVRGGGRLVVQYGQQEMTRPGMMPYPITIHRPHDRVTDENAPVKILSPSAPGIAGPNRIGSADFEGWVQERALYMPRVFDERYVPLLEMNDPGEPGNRGAILVAPYGKGSYVYTTLSLFRQLPAGVPGAARLMLNLLVADAPPRPTARHVPDTPAVGQ